MFECQCVVYNIPQTLHTIFTFTFLHLPWARLSARLQSKLPRNLMLSINFILYVTVFSFFFISIKKVLYFSVFSPRHSNCLSNLSAISWIMKWQSFTTIKDHRNLFFCFLSQITCTMYSAYAFVYVMTVITNPLAISSSLNIPLNFSLHM